MLEGLLVRKRSVPHIIGRAYLCPLAVDVVLAWSSCSPGPGKRGDQSGAEPLGFGAVGRLTLRSWDLEMCLIAEMSLSSCIPVLRPAPSPHIDKYPSAASTKETHRTLMCSGAPVGISKKLHKSIRVFFQATYLPGIKYVRR